MASKCGVYKSHNNAVCPLCIGANAGYTCCNGTVVETELSTGETVHFHKPVPENDLFRFDPVWMGSRSGVMMRVSGTIVWRIMYSSAFESYDRLVWKFWFSRCVFVFFLRFIVYVPLFNDEYGTTIDNRMNMQCVIWYVTMPWVFDADFVRVQIILA